MKKNILIVGAGQAGTSLAQNLENNNEKIIGFIDDNISNDQILGKTADINHIIKKYKVTDVMIAMPSTDTKRVREIFNSILSNQVHISIVPHSIKILKKNKAEIKDLEKISFEQLLGRPPRKRDVKALKNILKNQKILVTGAAGSIGSEIMKQATEFNAKEIIAVDWWENGLFNLQQNLQQYKNIIYKVCNIQNYNHIKKIINSYKPNIIFHAAAYKHVPLMEKNSLEAYNNNVGGTYSLMQIANQEKVKEFVFISTDKAVNPTNVMGSTKRICELFLKKFAYLHKFTNYRAVRFGNVMGSNGSVIPLFKKQIREGGPVTLTHKDVKRYFMTIPEAVSLVLGSLTLKGNGNIYILDMGEEIKIIDIAKSLIKFSGKNISIKTIGLRPGEKMYEELSYNPDNLQQTKNERIFLSEKGSNSINKDLFEFLISLIKDTKNYKIDNITLKQILKNKMNFNIKV